MTETLPGRLAAPRKGRSRYQGRRLLRGALPLGLLLLFASIAAACGDDSDDAAPTATTQASATTPSTTATEGSPGATEGGDAAWEAVVADAEEEGTLTHYASTVGVSERTGPVFEEKHGIKLEFLRASVGELLPRVDEELLRGVPGADVLSINGDQWFIDNAPNLLPLQGPNVAAMAEARPDLVTETQVAIGLTPFALAYNTNEVTEPITTYSDLLRPELEGRIAIINPTAEVLQVMIGEIDEMLPEFWTEMKNMGLTSITGTPALCAAVGSGEVAVAIGATVSSCLPVIEGGAPLEMVFPSESTVVSAVFSGVLKTSANPNAAQLYVDFMASEEGQRIVHEGNDLISPMEGIGGIDIGDTPTILFDPEKWTPEATAAALAKFQEVTGL